MRLVLLLSFSFIVSNLFSQKILQIERLHSPKTKKFYPTNEITFQTKDGQWYTRVIADLNYENNWLIFNDGYIDLNEVTTIRSFKNKRWSQSLGNRLMFFAPIWGLYRGVAYLAADDVKFGRGDYLIMGGALGTGLALKLIFKSKNYRFYKDGKPSKKHRLRILDLNVN